MLYPSDRSHREANIAFWFALLAFCSVFGWLAERAKWAWIGMVAVLLNGKNWCSDGRAMPCQSMRDAQATAAKRAGPENTAARCMLPLGTGN